ARDLDATTLLNYLPAEKEKVPAVISKNGEDSFSEREIMYKFLFDMKKDLSDLKNLVLEMISQGSNFSVDSKQAEVISRLYSEAQPAVLDPSKFLPKAKE